jgi:hypothetical protein
LGAFGGMGSLNDVVLDDDKSNEMFRSLTSEAYDLATTIKSDQ